MMNPKTEQLTHEDIGGIMENRHDTPFMRFWLAINDHRRLSHQPEILFGEAQRRWSMVSH